MANVVKHRFLSAKTDGADASQVQPSHWNDGHAFTGGGTGDVLTRDLSDATFGAKWGPGGYRQIDNGDLGIVYNWAPAGFGTENTVIHWTGGTTNLSVTGLVAGIQGQIVTIKNRGTGVLYFWNKFSGSSTPNWFYNAVSSGATMVGTNGWIQFIYYGAWILTGHEQGGWITQPFSAADYMGPWTVTAGSVIQCNYRLSGTTLQWALYVASSTVTTASGSLWRAIPNGYDAKTSSPVILACDGAAAFHALGLHEPGNHRMMLLRDAGLVQQFPAGTLHVYFTATCEVV